MFTSVNSSELAAKFVSTFLQLQNRIGPFKNQSVRIQIIQNWNQYRSAFDHTPVVIQVGDGIEVTTVLSWDIVLVQPDTKRLLYICANNLHGGSFDLYSSVINGQFDSEIAHLECHGLGTQVGHSAMVYLVELAMAWLLEGKRLPNQSTLVKVEAIDWACKAGLLS